MPWSSLRRYFVGVSAACAGLVLPLVSYAQTTGSNTQVRLSVPIGSMSSVAAEGGLAQYIVGVYGYMLGIVTIVAIIMVMYGGFRYLLGSTYGDVKTGKNIITDALGGMAVLFLAYFILYNVNPKTVTLQVPGLTRIRSVALNTNARALTCSGQHWTLTEASREIGARRPAGSRDSLEVLRERGVSVDFMTCAFKRLGGVKCDANVQCISGTCQGISPLGGSDTDVPASLSSPEDLTLGAGTCAFEASSSAAALTPGAPMPTQSCPADKWNFAEALRGVRTLTNNQSLRVEDLVDTVTEVEGTSPYFCHPRRAMGQRCDVDIQCVSNACVFEPRPVTNVSDLITFVNPSAVTLGIGVCQ